MFYIYVAGAVYNAIIAIAYGLNGLDKNTFIIQTLLWVILAKLESRK